MNDRGQHLARRSADFSVPLFLSVKRGRGRKERRGEGIQARYGKRKEGKRKGGKGDFSLLPTWKKKELSPILHTHKLITRSKLRRGGRRRRGGEGVCPGRRGREGGRKARRTQHPKKWNGEREKERKRGIGAQSPDRDAQRRLTSSFSSSSSMAAGGGESKRKIKEREERLITWLKEGGRCSGRREEA